jgi:hypothetical protein
MAKPQQFEIIKDDDPTPDAEAARGAGLLLLALRALSQRAIAAIADLFFLLTVASAFWLWTVTPSPNSYQIVALSIYAAFVLAANWLVRRK